MQTTPAHVSRIFEKAAGNRLPELLNRIKEYSKIVNDTPYYGRAQFRPILKRLISEPDSGPIFGSKEAEKCTEKSLHASSTGQKLDRSISEMPPYCMSSDEFIQLQRKIALPLFNQTCESSEVSCLPNINDWTRLVYNGASNSEQLNFVHRLGHELMVTEHTRLSKMRRSVKKSSPGALIKADDSIRLENLDSSGRADDAVKHLIEWQLVFGAMMIDKTLRLGLHPRDTVCRLVPAGGVPVSGSILKLALSGSFSETCENQSDESQRFGISSFLKSGGGRGEQFSGDQLWGVVSSVHWLCGQAGTNCRIRKKALNVDKEISEFISAVREQAAMMKEEYKIPGTEIQLKDFLSRLAD
jgi:hypothetical protein